VTETYTKEIEAMQNEESQYIALKVNIAKETIEKNKKSDLVDPNESNQIEIRD
jgi:hypothetical protein